MGREHSKPVEIVSLDQATAVAKESGESKDVWRFLRHLQSLLGRATAVANPGEVFRLLTILLATVVFQDMLVLPLLHGLLLMLLILFL